MADKQQEQFSQGSLFVNENECKFSADRSKGTVVIESTNPDFPRAIEELRDAAARNLATTYATSVAGVADARVNGNLIGPYAVNDKGVPLDKVAEDNQHAPLAVNHPSLQPAAYRVEVPVTRAMR